MFSCDELVGGTRVRGTCRRGKEQNKREHVLLSRVHSYTEYWSRSAGTRLLVSLAARRWLLPPWLQLQLQLRLVPLTPAASHRAWPRDLRNYSPSSSSLYWISESIHPVPRFYNLVTRGLKLPTYLYECVQFIVCSCEKLKFTCIRCTVISIIQGRKDD